MDAVVQGPPDDGGQDLNLVDATEWASQNSQEIVNNNTFLYIAVEYVKDEYKMEPSVNLNQPQEAFTDLEQHVSPLDPNMSSVARYSPVYNEPTTEYNPVVIHQLVQESPQNQIINLNTNTTLETMPVLCNNDIREVVDNHFMQMVPTTEANQELQVVPPNDQEVALLITDQETGISYSVRPQELLVEDEQLLNALSPDPLLDSHLLSLDENTLKIELSDEIISSAMNSAVNYISNLGGASDDNHFRMETRRQKQNDIEMDEQLLSKVYSIVDKPVLSRARATLPESYLSLNKVDEGFGVFAKKTIPKSTQFGPLTGILKPVEGELKDTPSELLFLIEDEQILHELDVSDEDTSNWMRFIRKAQNYNEQNLLITQEGSFLFFTTTKTVLPKQELKVGYSMPYATAHKLTALKAEEEKSWPCYECNECFATSEQLQKHLNIHDNEADETKKNRKVQKNVKKVNSREAMQCNNCNEIFSQPVKIVLRQHLIEKHLLSGLDVIDQYFTSIMNYKCDNCEAVFSSEALLKLHNFLHEPDTSDELTSHICPGCQKKFPTQHQLVVHVGTHAIVTTKTTQPESFKCPVCNKLFALRERLRRHMLVHGSDESKPLQCKTCNKRFINNSALTGHVKTHLAGKKIFECPICKESFDHVLKLKSHVPVHCENNMYSCPYCNKVFKKYSIIRKHIRAFHCDQKHACPHCVKMFPTLDKLKMHLLRHSDHREFLCADCGKQFKRKDKLKEHCKRMHSEERENDAPRPQKQASQTNTKPNPKTEPTDFHRFIYKCHTCLVGFKRRGMLVNHLAKRHPDISPDSVPELNLPILQTTRDYYCQHCDKVYKSNSKRKAHILKNHPGAALPMSNRKQGNFHDGSGLPNPTFTQTVGSITTRPQNCKWCHKQYASKAKLLQHQRKKHSEMMAGQGNVETKQNEEKFAAAESSEVQNEQNCLQEEFKQVSEVDILNNALEEYDGEREGEQFCHLIISGNDSFEQNGDLSAPNSHLYRLLTNSNELPSLVPPR